MVSKWLGLALAAACLIFGISAWPSVRGWFEDTDLAAPTNRHGYGRAEVKFSEITVNAAIPLTPALQAQGLGGRTSLGATEGMLWLFDPVTTPSFWMKDMVIPIDIIWIRSGYVVEIGADLPPPTAAQPELRIYRPRQAVDAVLEVESGFAAAHEVFVGEIVAVDIK